VIGRLLVPPQLRELNSLVAVPKGSLRSALQRSHSGHRKLRRAMCQKQMFLEPMTARSSQTLLDAFKSQY
jgi:hypothetical protein